MSSTDISSEMTNRMKMAWECYQNNNISETCRLLLEIQKECQAKEIALPEDHDDLAMLCMLQDSMELLAEKIESDQKSSSR